MKSAHAPLYYRIDSDGEGTNIQLYTLRQANIYWCKLSAEFAEYGDETEKLRERCCFVITLAAMSVVQLLGQNTTSGKKRIPKPCELVNEFKLRFPSIVIDETKFKRLIEIYDAFRHFGVDESHEKHRVLSGIDFDETKKLIIFCHSTWRKVVRSYGKEPGADVKSFNPAALGD